MKCQCRFIISEKCAILVSDAGNEEDYAMCEGREI